MPVKVGLRYIDIWKSSMEDAVRAYEAEPIIKGQIVFYGPSYFTRWSTRYGMKPLRECILGKSGEQCAVNRGFGSSCSEHQLYYYPRMVKPLEPKVLVYSSHANGASFGYTNEEIWELAQRVVMYALTDFPDIKIYLCGSNGSRDMTEERIANNLRYDEWIRKFAEDTPNCHFVDIMNSEYVKGKKDIYVDDGVHYNQSGYDLYTKLFNDALADELSQY